MATCKCPIYPFPHREGGGACRVGHEPVCSACGKPCHEVRIDIGIGPYEFWGQRGVDHHWTTGSDCCHSAIL